MAARGKHEGTVSEVKPGVWRGRISLGGTRHSVNGPTRAAVVRALTTLRQRYEQHRLTPGGRDTLGEYLTRWLAQRVGTVGDRQYANHQRNVETYLAPLHGVRLDQLTADHVRTLYAELQQPPAVVPEKGPGRRKALGPRSIKLVHTTISQALQQAVEDGKLARNVALAVRTPKLQRKEQQVLSRREQATLLAHAAKRGDRLVALWTLALRTAFRSGELLALKWSDVDWQRKTITVQRVLARVEAGRPVFKDEAKSVSSARTIALTEDALAALRAHRKRQNDERMKYGFEYADYGLIFCTRIGTALDRTNVSHYWQRACQRAGVAIVRLHDARHTGASSYIAAGVPIPEVAQILGHASAQVTAQIYSHAISRSTRHAAQALERFLAEADEEAG